MTKLEEKLKELKYEKHPDNPELYYKPIHNYIDIHIYVKKNEIINYGVNRTFLISYVKEANFIIKALRIMRNDLKELEQCQD